MDSDPVRKSRSVRFLFYDYLLSAIGESPSAHHAVQRLAAAYPNPARFPHRHRDPERGGFCFRHSGSCRRRKYQKSSQSFYLNRTPSHHFHPQLIKTQWQFNTSSVNADIANYLSQQNGGDSDVPLGRKVYDWYEVHYLAVCKGMWSNGVVGVENASTIQCEPKSAGYTFSLSSELAADTVPAAQNLFANWSYGTLQTEASMVLLAMGIGFMGLSLLAYLYCLITRPMLERADSLIALVIALVSHGIAVILLTNSSAEITVKAHKLTDLASVTLPVTLNAWQTKAFYVLIWMSVGFMWGAVPIAVIIALLVGGIFIPLLCEYERRSHEDRKFSAPLEPPKVIF